VQYAVFESNAFANLSILCVWYFVAARAAYGEIDASEGRRLRKRPEPKEPEPKKASPVSFSNMSRLCGEN